MRRIRCISLAGFLPITYTLLHNEAIREITVLEKRDVSFNIIIYIETNLGPYKCAADIYVTETMYSDEFTYSLAEPTSHWLILSMRLLIFLDLVVLTMVIMLVMLRTGIWNPGVLENSCETDLKPCLEITP